MSDPALEAQFHEAMVGVYEQAKIQVDYHATYFIQMVSEMGGLPAARKLITDASPSQGFTTLWEKRRLDLTVEALVLRPEFAPLFTRVELRKARKRLADHGMDVP